MWTSKAGKERSMHVCVAQAPAGRISDRSVCEPKLKSLCDMVYKNEVGYLVIPLISATFLSEPSQ